MSKHFLAALILISACISGPARAQDAAAPFDGDLQRLAEILGTLHYLRGICGTNERAKWRNEMQALVDAETPSGEPVLNDELDDFKWLPPDALGDLKLTGGLQEVIQSARRVLGA